MLVASVKPLCQQTNRQAPNPKRKALCAKPVYMGTVVHCQAGLSCQVAQPSTVVVHSACPSKPPEELLSSTDARAPPKSLTRLLWDGPQLWFVVCGKCFSFLLCSPTSEPLAPPYQDQAPFCSGGSCCGSELWLWGKVNLNYKLGSVTNWLLSKSLKFYRP